MKVTAPKHSVLRKGKEPEPRWVTKVTLPKLLLHHYARLPESWAAAPDHTLTAWTVRCYRNHARSCSSVVMTLLEFQGSNV